LENDNEGRNKEEKLIN